MRIKILIAIHKKTPILSNEIHMPIFVGSRYSKENLPYQRDDEGVNISEKNRWYCELTALYWAYQNMKDIDYIGLCHYRRYFKKNEKLLDKNEAERILQLKPVILPKKRHYYIETVYSQFVHSHGKEAINTVRETIMDYYPDYLSSFDSCMKRRSLHICNMLVMRKDIFYEYCDFLFGVLFKAEEKTILKDRIMGFLGERLLDVFITKNQVKYSELPIINQEKINWPKKVFVFMKRKFKGALQWKNMII